jgi:hypothetical protein
MIVPIHNDSLLSKKGLQCSRSFGGVKLQELCVIWYLSLFTCLYDLLQFGFGQWNGLERRSDEAGQKRVVLARGVEVGKGEDEVEAEVDASAVS